MKEEGGVVGFQTTCSEGEGGEGGKVGSIYTFWASIHGAGLQPDRAAG